MIMTLKSTTIRVTPKVLDEVMNLKYELLLKDKGDVIEYLIREHKGLPTEDLVFTNGNGKGNLEEEVTDIEYELIPSE